MFKASIHEKNPPDAISMHEGVANEQCQAYSERDPKQRILARQENTSVVLDGGRGRFHK